MEAKIFRNEEIDWTVPPEHYGALSKLLVTPQNSSTKYFDFRISVYQPDGKVAPHTHRIQETIWYIMRGVGVVVLEKKRYLVEPGMVVYIPAGVEHSIINTGGEDLMFTIVISPPKDS